MASQKRIQEELAAMTKSPPPFCTAGPDRSNLYRWNATIAGPPNSPYQGGMFKLSIEFKRDYPQSPPEVLFLTKIYHMNICEDGTICLDILDKSKKWNSSVTVSKILMALCSLLSTPNPEDPLNWEKAQLFKTDRITYSETAREWTVRYAK